MKLDLDHGLIVISANSSWNVVNFRSGLIRALVAQNHRVVVIAPKDSYSDQIVSLGAEYRPITLASSGVSLIDDGRSLLRYRRLLRELRPRGFLGFTAKPNIYGSLAALGLGIRIINNISGLGTAFMKPGVLQGVVSILYRCALARSAVVFFQNPDDRDLFIERRLARPDQARLLNGSGIDLDQFCPPQNDRELGPLRFLLVARVLRDKGVEEYVGAARILRGEGSDARFGLLGPTDADNRTAISAAQVASWQDEGLVEYLGTSDDVRPHLAAADCVVLPSYREGLPRSLIEAAAMGKPIITTDVPGCRGAVEDGVTGLLCEARSAKALADAVRKMIAFTESKRRAMGRAGRDRAERLYDQDIISAAYLDEIEPYSACRRSAS